MLIILPNERPLTWNKLYAGRHWARRDELAKEKHKLVFYTIKEQHPHVLPFEGRVRIVVRAYFKSNPQDPDNISAKLYIDGLHGTVIHDDNMKYVASVTTEAYMDKKNPRVEIEIKEEDIL